MKKTLALLLALMLLVTSAAFVSCQKQETPAQRLQRALDATQASDAIDATIEMTMEMSASGVYVEIPMSMDVKTKGVHSKTPVSSVVMQMEMFGMTLEIPMYMEGEWVYTSMMGESYKTKIDEADTDYTALAQSFTNDLPASLLEGQTMTKNGDGSETVTIAVPSDTFTELFSEAMGLAGDTAGLDGEVGDVAVKDATVTITIKDGLVRQYDMAYVMEMSAGGIATQMNVSTNCTYHAFGDDVTVTPPEGYLDYPEMDESLLG